MSRLPCLGGQTQQHRFLSNSYGNRGRGADASGWESQTDLRKSKNHEKLLHYGSTVRLKIITLTFLDSRFVRCDRKLEGKLIAEASTWRTRRRFDTLLLGMLVTWILSNLFRFDDKRLTPCGWHNRLLPSLPFLIYLRALVDDFPK